MLACNSFAVVLTLFAVKAYADVYMHIPRGSNNRLDGQNRERRNANRLFDSQNNDRGGYNVGRDTAIKIDNQGTERRVPVGEMKYYAGSQMSIEWTNQHECGGVKAKCDIIIQYMCDPGLRDGETTDTIPDKNARCPEQDCNSRSARRFGQQEPAINYQLCRLTERNKGLFTADQDLAGESAIYTRQNPNGQRRGLECPEERDYYPYWRPSMWKDIAILTTHTERCKMMQEESGNVKPKSLCIPSDPGLYFSRMDRQNQPRAGELMPNNKVACENKIVNGMRFKWISLPAADLPKPECLPTPKSRDNHLGNGGARPYAHVYNWTVPNLDAKACALRIRYNISTGDYPLFSTDAKNNNNADGVNIGINYGIPESDGAKERGYILENNPEIKPLKVDGSVQKKLNLQLNVNTAQIGRTFEDRSHAFSIVPRPSSIPADARIYNLNVRGKRGNIVQVFPAVEYDFTPNDLRVKKGDYVHPQWTGSLRNPNNNDGEGARGTDKSNMIALHDKNYPEGTGQNMLQPNDRTGHLGNNYPEKVDSKRFLGLSRDNALRTAILVPDLVGLVDYKYEDLSDSKDEAESSYDDEDLDVMGDKASASKEKRFLNIGGVQRTGVRIRKRLDLSLLNDAPAYFNLGPVKTETCGASYYMSTRNNNFSNRSQKGKVTVECNK